jgi:hypothetical protein
MMTGGDETMRVEEVIRMSPSRLLCPIFAALFLLGLSSCGEKQVPFEDQFGLRHYTKEQFDLYNPILHTCKVDSLQRSHHMPLDVYLNGDTAKFMFSTDGSYGYLHRFEYDSTLRLQTTRIYPVLNNSIDKDAHVFTDEYYYQDKVLSVMRDELLDRILVQVGDTVVVYIGVLTGTRQFRVVRMDPRRYYTWHLSSVIDQPDAKHY